jgi:hypothetical protein
VPLRKERRETASNLASGGLAEDRMDAFTEGFSKYRETELLEQFLEKV